MPSAPVWVPGNNYTPQEGPLGPFQGPSVGPVLACLDVQGSEYTVVQSEGGVLRVLKGDAHIAAYRLPSSTSAAQFLPLPTSPPTNSSLTPLVLFIFTQDHSCYILDTHITATATAAAATTAGSVQQDRYAGEAHSVQFTATAVQAAECSTEAVQFVPVVLNAGQTASSAQPGGTAGVQCITLDKACGRVPPSVNPVQLLALLCGYVQQQVQMGKQVQAAASSFFQLLWSHMQDPVPAHAAAVAQANAALWPLKSLLQQPWVYRSHPGLCLSIRQSDMTDIMDSTAEGVAGGPQGALQGAPGASNIANGLLAATAPDRCFAAGLPAAPKLIAALIAVRGTSSEQRAPDQIRPHRGAPQGPLQWPLLLLAGPTGALQGFAPAQLLPPAVTGFAGTITQYQYLKSAGLGVNKQQQDRCSIQWGRDGAIGHTTENAPELLGRRLLCNLDQPMAAVLPIWGSESNVMQAVLLVGREGRCVCLSAAQQSAGPLPGATGPHAGPLVTLQQHHMQLQGPVEAACCLQLPCDTTTADPQQGPLQGPSTAAGLSKRPQGSGAGCVLLYVSPNGQLWGCWVPSAGSQAASGAVSSACSLLLGSVRGLTIVQPTVQGPSSAAMVLLASGGLQLITASEVAAKLKPKDPRQQLKACLQSLDTLSECESAAAKATNAIDKTLQTLSNDIKTLALFSKPFQFPQTFPHGKALSVQCTLRPLPVGFGAPGGPLGALEGALVEVVMRNEATEEFVLRGDHEMLFVVQDTQHTTLQVALPCPKLAPTATWSSFLQLPGSFLSGFTLQICLKTSNPTLDIPSNSLSHAHSPRVEHSHIRPLVPIIEIKHAGGPAGPLSGAQRTAAGHPPQAQQRGTEKKKHGMHTDTSGIQHMSRPENLQQQQQRQQGSKIDRRDSTTDSRDSMQVADQQKQQQAVCVAMLAEQKVDFWDILRDVQNWPIVQGVQSEHATFPPASQQLHITMKLPNATASSEQLLRQMVGSGNVIVQGNTAQLVCGFPWQGAVQQLFIRVSVTANGTSAPCTTAQLVLASHCLPLVALAHGSCMARCSLLPVEAVGRGEETSLEAAEQVAMKLLALRTQSEQLVQSAARLDVVRESVRTGQQETARASQTRGTRQNAATLPQHGVDDLNNSVLVLEGELVRQWRELRGELHQAVLAWPFSV